MADFHGLPVGVLSSPHLRVEYLATAGPRLVRLFLAGVEGNLLAEVPGWGWETPYGRYYPYGGHRLWCAPESMPRTYIPDSDGLTVEELADGVRLTRPAERVAVLARSLEVHLDPQRPALTLRHTLRNEADTAVELAPWAITQLPLGGWALLPQNLSPLDEVGLRPNRNLVLWPYTRWEDERLYREAKGLLFQAQARPDPFKIGYFNSRGWIAYARQGVLFRKRFPVYGGRAHPDMECNAELYCNDRFVELETLGPLVRLEPGQTASHVEQWELEVLPLLRSDDREALRRLLGDEGRPGDSSPEQAGASRHDEL